MYRSTTSVQMQKHDQYKKKRYSLVVSHAFEFWERNEIIDVDGEFIMVTICAWMEDEEEEEDKRDFLILARAFAWQNMCSAYKQAFNKA